VTCAVVTIDLQYEFMDPNGSAAGHFEKSVCVPGVQTLLEAARDHGHRVIHVRSIHEDAGSIPKHLRASFPSGYCLRGSPGAEMLAGLVLEGEPVIEKGRFSAFAGTDLRDRLAGVDRVVLAGLAVDCCVLATAFDAARDTDAEVLVPYQAVSATSPALYLAGLGIIAKSLGAVVDLRELLENGGDFSATALQGDAIDRMAGPWIHQQLSVASALAGSPTTPGPVQSRVDALLAEFVSSGASLLETPLPTNE